MTQAREALGRSPADIAPAALDQLCAYRWPGNVRELRNVIRRAALIASDTIAPKHLDGSLDQNASPVIPFPGKAASALSLRHKIQNQTRMIERDAVVGALEQAKGNKTEAARLLGIDYETYRMKLKELG